MPPKVATKDAPVGLRAYLFHGLDLRWEERGGEATGACPWCDKEGKFYVNVETGLWQCKVCLGGTKRGGGNATTFIKELWDLSFRGKSDYSALSADRGVSEETLQAWGVCRSAISGDWLVPGYDASGKLSQLYRYAKVPGDTRTALLATPGMAHQLLGLLSVGEHDWNSADRQDVYVCEGPWDGMALHEAMLQAKDNGKGELVFTGNPEASLMSGALVVAVPAAGVFQEWWGPVFAGRRVVMLYDNDHPREVKGKTVDGAGYVGMRLASGRLANMEEKPTSVHYIRWSHDGSYWEKELPTGSDVRDWLLSAKPGTARAASLQNLLTRVHPIPNEWVPGRTKGKDGGVDMDLLPCRTWDTVVASARKALRWNEGLDRALSVMLASVSSVKAAGDQLWVKVVSPASSGKSVLCEALSTNRDYVRAVSTMRGFHSGYKTDKEGEDDHSLLATLKDVTLVTKDGDTLLQSPNLPQILSEARDIYDRVSRSHYRHGMSREYVGINMTWILCGTSSLRSLDHSELGERFLDCVIVDEIDEEEERVTALRKAYSAHRDLSVVADGTLASMDAPEMTRFKALVGGYVKYLRENARDLLGGIELTEARAEECVDLGTFVAYMRARPSDRQKEKAEREMSYRLTSQMLRLAACLAVVLNRDSIDAEVMRRVKRVAMDTARGKTMELTRAIHACGEAGAEVRGLAHLINETEPKARELLRFLKDIKVAEPFKRQLNAHVAGAVRWRLAPRVSSLWERVVGNAG